MRVRPNFLVLVGIKTLKTRYSNLLITFIFAILFGTNLCAQSTEWVPGEYIVKYNPQEIDILREDPALNKYSQDQIQAALTEIMAANVVEALPIIEAKTIVANDKNELDIETAVDLIDSELIEYISPNFIRKINITPPNDPRYAELWGMSQGNDIDVNALEASAKATFTETENVVVGVVDTGIDYNHPDLLQNMWKNPQELNGAPGVDDDGNGVIDDIYGYNAINNSGNPFDDQSHGTHCAGTIGARGNNGIGVAGVAWKVKLMGLKFLDSQGRGSDSNAIKAINYAINMKNKGGSLRILSNSWGGGGYNPALLNVIQAANDNGILFVAAAGNDNKNTDVSANYPSNYNVPNVISVAAIDSQGNRASFSNYGATTVDIAAPGVGILSTVPNSGYASYNGTSMATPHVSGLAVLAYAQNTEQSPASVKELIFQSLKPISKLNGLMVYAGIPNAEFLASDQLNRAPILQPIKNQIIYNDIRKIAVPLVAFDIENEQINYSVESGASNTPSLSQAALLDKQYNFVSYLKLPNELTYKVIYNGNNEMFVIRYDGALIRVVGNVGTIIAQLEISYFNDPLLLVNAYVGDPAPKIKTEIKNSGIPYIEIEAKSTFSGQIEVIAKASDGNKIDTKTFFVSLENKGVCQ